MKKNVDRIRPRNDLVLVRRVEEKYEGLIQLPQGTEEKPMLAEVVAVGPGVFYETTTVTRRPMDLRPGQQVYIGKYSGTEIEEGGEKLTLLREAEILAVRD